ncbi:MAG: hypothetical protein R2875_05590 [Desulfobacterales bacterium]
MVNSLQFDGLDNIAAQDKIADYLEASNLGKRAVSFRLRDWGISRQRFWGHARAMIHCDSCGIVPVAEEDLPAVLPENVDLLEGGGSPFPSWTRSSTPPVRHAADRPAGKPIPWTRLWNLPGILSAIAARNATAPYLTKPP